MKYALPLALFLALTGCTKSFQVATPMGETTKVLGNDNSDTGNENWQTLNINSSISSGPYQSTRSIELDKQNKMVLIRLPLMLHAYFAGMSGEVPIQQVPGAKITFEVSSSGSSVVVFHIPLNYFVRGIDFLPADRLPNGDALPGVPDGELPSLAVKLPVNQKEINAYLYFGKATFSVYVNLPIDPYISMTFPIRNQQMTQTYGFFSLIPAKSPHDGGAYISVALPSEIARVIDDNL